MDLKPEQIQQMIGLLQSMLEASQNKSADYHEDEDDDEATKPVHKIKSSGVKKRKSSKSSPKHTNMFDAMMEAKMHKDDCKIDKLLSVHEPTPRVREFTPIKVTCRVCGKTENINPVILTDSADRYKCNKCARSAG